MGFCKKHFYFMRTNFNRLKSVILVGTFVAISFINSFAQDRNYIAISSAVFDILQQDDASFETRIEFRYGKAKFLVQPFNGVMINTEGAMHIYFGFYYDIKVAGYLYITPSFAPGLYARRNSKDLKFALEFRSQLEVSFRFNNDVRIGFSFNHISNASLGIKNPGVESVAVTYIIPL